MSEEKEVKKSAGEKQMTPKRIKSKPVSLPHIYDHRDWTDLLQSLKAWSILVRNAAPDALGERCLEAAMQLGTLRVVFHKHADFDMTGQRYGEVFVRRAERRNLWRMLDAHARTLQKAIDWLDVVVLDGVPNAGIMKSQTRHLMRLQEALHDSAHRLWLDDGRIYC